MNLKVLYTAICISGFLSDPRFSLYTTLVFINKIAAKKGKKKPGIFYRAVKTFLKYLI